MHFSRSGAKSSWPKSWAVALASVAMLAVAHAQQGAPGPAPAHPHKDAARACLDQKERRAESESGRLVRLAIAMRVVKKHMPGTVVRARLCHGHDKDGHDRLVYVLTVLARDGKVARIDVDAVTGTLVGSL